MSTNFQVAVKKSKGNLHLHTKGDFNGNSACELVNLLHEQYDGDGRIFIDTHELCEICPFGCSTFRCQLHLGRVPACRIIFTGENGHEIAPEGSRVIVDNEEHKCRCNGNCKNCPCKKQNKG